MRSLSALVCLTLAQFLFIGCSGIKIEKDVKVMPGDWVMAGGSPEQQHISGYSLAPPLNLMWDYDIEGGVGPSGIAVADAVLFVNALQGEMFTFDIASGGKIGNIKFLGKDASTSPLVLGNNVIITFAGDKKSSLVSYDISKGLINWNRNYGDIQTSPVLKDEYVYFGNLKGIQYKVDVASGRKEWKFNSGSPIHSTCAVAYGCIIFGNDKGIISCLSATEGNEIWKIETHAPVISTPMINNGKAYLGGNDSIYRAIELSSGNIIWKNNMHTKIIAGSALYQNKADNSEQVIFGCVDGSIYSVEITGGSVIWKFQTKGIITSTPVISGDYVYCTSYDSYVYSLNARTGEMLWNCQLENKIKTTPIVWKDYLFVAADEIIYCFTNKTFEIKN